VSYSAVPEIVNEGYKQVRQGGPQAKASSRSCRQSIKDEGCSELPPSSSMLSIQTGPTDRELAARRVQYGQRSNKQLTEACAAPQEFRIQDAGCSDD
jgi:hypothetical protein